MQVISRTHSFCSKFSIIVLPFKKTINKWKFKKRKHLTQILVSSSTIYPVGHSPHSLILFLLASYKIAAVDPTELHSNAEIHFP